MISIHAPMRGRLEILAAGAVEQDFNPRPHAGATLNGLIFGAVIGISIHAPMRGRRTHPPKYYGYVDISIHAPMRGRLALQPL